MRKSNGLLMATTAAALFTGALGAASNEQEASEAKVHCAGVNACKGTSECRSPTNACKGQNMCARAGWVATTPQECESKGGTVLK